MLPARYRMTRSTEFGTTVGLGTRSVQPDVVVHMRRGVGDEFIDGPKVGLVVAKAVGNSVERHRVARQLRHVARGLLDELDPVDRMVIRARPGSRHANSARLEKQVRIGLERTRSKVAR